MSLRLRLLLAVVGVSLIALVVADVATYRALKSFLFDRVDQSLTSTRQPLESRFGFGPGGGGHRGGGPAQQPFVDQTGTFVQLRDGDGTIEVTSPYQRRNGDTYSPNLPDDMAARASDPGSSGFMTVGSTEPGGPEFRVRYTALPNDQLLIVGAPLDDTTETLHRLLVIELAVTAAALFAAFGIGWWLVRVGLRPLTDVEETAEAIADGDLDRRVPRDDEPTEVGAVARALNTMLGRIQDAFTQRDATESELRRSEARMRQFVADASHELRTPLTAVSAYAELFERGAGEHPEDLPRVMSGIRTETGRMSELVDDLLLLARLDEGRPLQREPVELVGMAAEAIDAARAVGDGWTFNLAATGSVEVPGDRGRLRQVVDNLLGNVRSHTPPGTVATLSIRTESDAAVIEVADDGPGMTDEQAARVFERFYRAEASRTRQHGGGAGLGLAIVAAIVSAHGGSVAAAAHGFAGGATFVVRLPLLQSGTLLGSPGSSQPAHS